MNIVNRFKGTVWPVVVETHRELIRLLPDSEVQMLAKKSSISSLPGMAHFVRFYSLSKPSKRKVEVWSLGKNVNLPQRFSCRQGFSKVTICHESSTFIKDAFSHQDGYCEIGKGWQTEFSVLEDLTKIIPTLKEFMAEIDSKETNETEVSRIQS